MRLSRLLLALAISTALVGCARQKSGLFAENTAADRVPFERPLGLALPTTEQAVVALLGAPEARRASPLSGGETVTLTYAGGDLVLYVTRANVRMFQLEAKAGALAWLEQKRIDVGPLVQLGRPRAEVERGLGKPASGGPDSATYTLTSRALAPMSMATFKYEGDRCAAVNLMLLPRAGVN